jgi:hypothetical protein
VLEEQESELTLYNSQKFSCLLSTLGNFEPLYMAHPLRLGQSEVSCLLQRVEGETRLPLFLA